ncbi:hypothetical protein JHK82_023322 [Glycine max]|nr:hypothetical protein JHK82_023322 [Glycine max]
MKAIIVFFLLLASVFFLPSSTLARQLLQKETNETRDPTHPATCSSNNGYINCKPSAPSRRCPIYSRHC